jgi:S1-C subfamily serine protease
MTNPIYDAIKRATVAIVLSHPESIPRKPFTIVGSGFCVHPEGIVVTCEHVLRSFVDRESYQRLMEAVSGNKSEAFELKGARPHAVFHSRVVGTEVHMIPVPIVNAVTKTDFDLALLKLHPHVALAHRFPSLSIADYEEVHEMMEIGTCGFPLGNVLQEQIGTVTSSFTKGMISSIIPAPKVAREHVRGFQLDLTATNGNSGGPVFSLATGRVLGVLQGGVVHPDGNPVQGLTKAEPIYPIFENDLIHRLVKGLEPPVAVDLL